MSTSKTIREDYFRTVPVSKIRLHGDYRFDMSCASAIRVTNFRTQQYPPVIKCVNDAAWFGCVGFVHSTDAYIRSWLLFNKFGLLYNCQELSWSTDNALCEQAYINNETCPEFNMSYEYDGLTPNIFEVDNSKHYEFDLPEEMLIMIPVDLNNPEYDVMGKEAHDKFVDFLVYKYLITTLPITNIREVNNV